MRRPTNTNALVGIFLLVLLAVFAGPTMLPRIVSSVVPTADESIPCEWLRTGNNRAEHQSIIGRQVTNPISLSVRTSNLPQTPDQNLVISILITNVSIGSVSIYYNPTQVRVGDDGSTSGLGIVFNSTSPQAAGSPTNVPIPERDIRLLGPRQSCVHRIEYAPNQYPDASIGTGNATVKAYYRNTSNGPTQPVNSLATPIFSTQGLWVGVAESEPVRILFAAS
jgi:hypothetical protein